MSLEVIGRPTSVVDGVDLRACRSVVSSTFIHRLATDSQSAPDQPQPTGHVITAVSCPRKIGGAAQSCVTHAACSFKSLTIYSLIGLSVGVGGRSSSVVGVDLSERAVVGGPCQPANSTNSSV